MILLLLSRSRRMPGIDRRPVRKLKIKIKVGQRKRERDRKIETEIVEKREGHCGQRILERINFIYYIGSKFNTN